jgi:hypothetical protein
MTDITQLIERLRDCAREAWRIHLVEEVIQPEDKTGFAIFHRAFKEAADALTDLEARLRIAEKRAEDAEGRDDFLMEILHMTPEELKELRELIKERKQS